MLAVLVLFALSDVAWGVLGTIMASLIAGPLLIVTKAVLKHDRRDGEVALALFEFGSKLDGQSTLLGVQSGKIDGLSDQVNRVEGRLDAHLDDRMVFAMKESK